MKLMKQANRHAGLWWIAIASLSIGIAIFILLKPAEYDMEVQRYRSMALMISFGITGLCLITGTRGRWFGKGL